MFVSSHALDAQLFDFGTAAPITPDALPRAAAGDDDFASPYLRREARFIALARALRYLSTGALQNTAARAGAYLAAGFADCTFDEDAEAQRRQLTYWHHIRPSIVGSSAPLGAVLRLDFAPVDQVLA
ncbi:hypothetical protein [Beijerinckia sp. L45]|uniref:hypothetical protein n=1 Tax=Beijerinckia sp. L45 TaxID=1641855 RepID=UPI00131B2FF9|nr:hypothetical protein [Beijerinckia sp. L45]